MPSGLIGGDARRQPLGSARATQPAGRGRFMTDRGLQHWIDDAPLFDNDEADENGDNGAEISGSDSVDSLLAGPAPERRKRKRKTKQQRVLEQTEDLLYDVTEFPAEPKFNNADLLKLGAKGIADREKGKVAYKVDFQKGDATGLEALQKMNRVVDKFEARVNRTDSRIYKKQKQAIGLDLDGDDDYDDDPVLHPTRDAALKNPVNFEGNQRRANAIALGHATPATATSSHAELDRPAPNRTSEWISSQPAPPRRTSPDKRTWNQDFVPLGDGGDSLFGDDDDADNAIHPNDVSDVPVTDVQQAQAGSSTLPQTILGATRLPDFARRTPSPTNDLPLPRTESVLSWNHAQNWAKSLRRFHRLDFFDHSGNRVDADKVVATFQLPDPPELKALDDLEVQVQVEDDDLLFVAMEEDQNQKARDKAARDQKRSEMLKKHEIAKALFKDLKACVMQLIFQDQKKMELERGKSPVIFPSLSSGSVANLSIHDETPAYFAQPMVVGNNQISTGLRDTGSGPESGNAGDHPLRVQSGGLTEHQLSREHDWPVDHARSRSNRPHPNVADAQSRHDGSRAPKGRDHQRETAADRGHYGRHARHPPRRTHGNTDSWSPRAVDRGNSRGSRRSSFAPRGNGRRGRQASGRGSQRHSTYDWGSGNDNASPSNNDDTGFVDLDPNSDRLDPIKMQFGKK